MREALAEALSDFDGAIVMVSHDRHLIGLVCDTFWRVADGVVEPFDGDLDEYAAWLRTPRHRAGQQAAAQRRRNAAIRSPRRPPRRARVNPLKLAEAEARVAELEGKLAALETEMADPARLCRRAVHASLELGTPEAQCVTAAGQGGSRTGRRLYDDA